MQPFGCMSSAKPKIIIFDKTKEQRHEGFNNPPSSDFGAARN
jgi:hypothetical protein